MRRLVIGCALLLAGVGCRAGSRPADAAPAVDAAPPAPPDAGRPPLPPNAYRATTEDGLDVVYHVVGNGPACLVHPGGPGLQWDYLRMPELEQHLTLVYIEPLGTGASDPFRVAPPSLKRRYAADIEAVRKATGEERICLLGHSYGGYVVMQYAREHGDRLAALILYSTSAVTGKEWARDTRRARKSFEKTSWYAAAAAAMEAPEPPDEYEHDCGRFRRIMPFYFADYEHRRAELDLHINAMRCWSIPRRDDEGDPDDLREELGKLNVPTLVIAGRRDWLFPPKWGLVTARSIKGARLVVLEKSGHFGHVEEPEAFTRAVLEFVEKL